MIWFVLKVIGPTLRYELHGPESLDGWMKEYDPMILCAWHDCIVMGGYFLQDRGFVVLTSRNFDAEFAARGAVRFGFGIVRGSSTSGGVGALKRLGRLLGLGHSAFFTVDGPRGPRHIVKSGAVVLARSSGIPIIPGLVRPAKAWRLPSWDGMLLAKPFSRVVVKFGEPIRVEEGASEDVVEARRKELQSALDRIDLDIEQIIKEYRRT